MTERDPDLRDPDFRPRQPSSSMTMWFILLLVIAGAAAGWWWYQHERAPAPAPIVLTPQPDSPPAPPPAVPPAVAASGPQFPLDAAQPEGPLPALASSDAAVNKALAELLGSKAVASFLRQDDFVRRAVATVDNLPRTQAPPSRWPVQPMPQRFKTRGAGEAQAIDMDNSTRYTPFVLFAETVDPAKANALYRKLYPLFQQAYEELGYPGKYFNDRLVAAIDDLLQAPEPTGPLRVKLTDVKSDSPSQQPWTRYEFVDPKLEALSSGQKMMVRMGLENERRMKARLKEFRTLVASSGAKK